MTDNPAVIRKVEGRGVPVKGNDIDTDRIIPARYLRSVTFEGLGEEVFKDERFNDDGSKKDHAFNDPKYDGAAILIVNRNFGCGSSREHAPQALMRFGIKAIVGESFAEIFAGNCISIGIPVFTADETAIADIQEMVEKQPEIELRLDVDGEILSISDRQIQLVMNSSAKTALLKGTWNTLDELLLNEDQIEQVYNRLPYVSQFS
jgi:3-isopropylmalate/(R)-2-methylmalate dehydratase small subunit